MKAWRRTSRPQPIAAAATQVNVLSVVLLDSSSARWTFSDTITSCLDATGITLGGFAGVTIVQIVGATIDVDYGAAVFPGDPWQFIAALVDIVFDSGLTAPDQAGIST